MAATLEAGRDAIVGRVPLGRIGEPDDVAGACIFLSSQAGSYVNGRVLLSAQFVAQCMLTSLVSIQRHYCSRRRLSGQCEPVVKHQCGQCKRDFRGMAKWKACIIVGVWLACKKRIASGLISLTRLSQLEKDQLRDCCIDLQAVQSIIICL